MDIAKLFLYLTICGLFFFAIGIVVQSDIVTVVGLLILVGLAGVIVAFANQEFKWFEKLLSARPRVVYVDRPREQVAPVRKIIHYPSSVPERFYQEPVYEEPEDFEESEYDVVDPFVDLDVCDNWGFLEGDKE